MEINADFDKRIVLHGPGIEWLDSPMKGVKRRPLDRVGAEVARATSFVSYDPNSKFSSHVHTGGEEFIVIDGVFQDEHGDFPTGTYVRNPPQSSHTPGSDEGCVIFVKLWQFDMEDRTEVVKDMNTAEYEDDKSQKGVQFSTLFEDSNEVVRLEKWAPGTKITADTPGGAEFLVLEGGFTEGADTLKPLSWLRIPVKGNFSATAGPEGAKVWTKTGHLRHVDEQRARVA